MSTFIQRVIASLAAWAPKRLYWRLWCAVIIGVVLFALLAGAVFRWSGEATLQQRQRVLAQLVSAVLPAAGSPIQQIEQSLWHWRGKLASDLALYRSDLTLIASTAANTPPVTPTLSQDNLDEAWAWRRRRPLLVLRLDDGRLLIARPLREEHRQRRPSWVLLLTLLTLGVAVGAYPVVRHFTRRLEALQRDVMQFGQGQLSTRAEVQGDDEVTQLARHFNQAAARIEQLVQAHQSLLANASHELRSPLARIRMAVEMLQQEPGLLQKERLKQELMQDVAELDQLIDEILLASRLDASPALTYEWLDLTALVAEECARVNAHLEEVAPIYIQGDARLLRRLLRNLLENARRYGGEQKSVDVSLSDLNAQADGPGRRNGAVELPVRLTVTDQGPGIPAAECEKIFEPFYRLPGTSETNGGVGLGLALVRKIAQQHGGSVVCLPRVTGGSCFELRLPKMRAQS